MDLRGDLPAPAGAGPRLPRGARARPVPARPRRLAPLPVPLAPGPLRLDARVRRRRPDAHLGGSRRRGRVPRALLDRAGRWTGRRARHRPEPHGDGRREPVLARPALAREVLRPRLAHRRAPPLLRRQRARRRADGGSRGVGGDAREGRRARAEGPDRRRADRPPGRPRESTALPRAAARGGDPAPLGREDPRARRAATAGVAGRGHDRLRVPERRHGALRRPRRRGAADPALRGLDRRAAALRRGRRRGEARAGADDVRRRSRAAGREAALPRRRRVGGGVVPASTAPTSSRMPGSSQPRIAPRSRPRVCRTTSRGSCCSRSAATTRSSSASSRRRRPCTRRASRTRRSTAGTASWR